ncbi:MAG: BREX system P-loop protein BrxC [Caldilineaceae bacterium]|nr:BREX system P-loop protein BrxC [Caldilineaceae bacterium]
MSENRTVFAKDPTSFTIPNDGVTVVSAPGTPEEWAVLRYELASFVCSGEYEEGLERVLSTFLGQLDQPRQPAVWVSGFYGSGKSHFVRVLQYLWQDVTFPDGAQAGGLVNVSQEISSLLRELATAGRRNGGLWAAAGKLGAGADDVRLALLSVLFQNAGLPAQFAPANFVIWLKQQNQYDFVLQQVEATGRTFERELNHLYVSPVLANALLAAFPDLAETPQGVLNQMRSQFPRNERVNEAEMLQAIEDVLRLQSTTPGKLPLTLLVLDELQQSIGDDSARTLQIQSVVEACSSRFGSQLLFVATGQAALEGTPQLSKLRDRFTVRVSLSDKDVEQVVREVVLRKAPDKVAPLQAVLERASGEINRHLQGTKIGPLQADQKDLLPEYPLLPTRRRFWERLLRAIDRPGTAAQLRTQLRMVHEATKAVALQPLGTVVAGDMLYDQQKASMLQSGVLLSDIAAIIAEQDDGSEEGKLRARLCATIFLIGELPREGALATGVQANPDTLADLLLENLAEGSAGLRQCIPPLMEQLVQSGVLMHLEGEYRLQTRESAEWERERRGHFSRFAADVSRLAGDRETEFRQRVTSALKDIKLLQGQSKTPRKLALYFGQEAPPAALDGPPIWVRDEWNVAERSVRDEAQAAGADSPLVFVFLPRRSADDLANALAGHAAAQATIDSRPTQQTTPEGIQARRAMQTRAEIERGAVDGYLNDILRNARVYQAGGNEVVGSSLSEAVESAAQAALTRLYPRFRDADDNRWNGVLRRAIQGAPDALSAVGHNSDTIQHPVCREVLAFVGGGGKSGLDVRRHFSATPFGWPQDAIDGALAVLVADNRVEAIGKNGQTVSAKEIVQSQIGVISFRAADVVITPIQRIGVRHLCNELQIPVKSGEEAQAIAPLLQKLIDLAGEVGGPPPLPLRPSTQKINELRAQTGNAQFVAVHQAKDELLANFKDWGQARKLQSERLPRWEVAQRLAAHAVGQTSLPGVQSQMDGIVKERSLLADPDPLKPLLELLAGILRVALQQSRQRLMDLRQRELDALQETDEWQRLGDEKWRPILAAHHLGPIPEPKVGTVEELLTSLDERPLSAWATEAEAIPTRIRLAREEAAKLLEPTAVRVRPKSTTLHTEEEVEAYVADLRQTLLGHIAAGTPIIL